MEVLAKIKTIYVLVGVDPALGDAFLLVGPRGEAHHLAARVPVSEYVRGDARIHSAFRTSHTHLNREDAWNRTTVTNRFHVFEPVVIELWRRSFASPPLEDWLQDGFLAVENISTLGLSIPSRTGSESAITMKGRGCIAYTRCRERVPVACHETRRLRRPSRGASRACSLRLASPCRSCPLSSTTS